MSAIMYRYFITYVFEVRNEPVTATREIWATSHVEAERILKGENVGIRLIILSSEKMEGREE